MAGLEDQRLLEAIRAAVVLAATEATAVAIKAALETGHLKTWPSGTNFNDSRDPVADGTGGDVAVRYKPATTAAADEFTLIAGMVQNRDIVAREFYCEYVVAATVRSIRLNQDGALAAGASLTYPTTRSTGQGWSSPSPLVVSGLDYIECRGVGITALEDTRFTVLLRCRGTAPTVTEVIA